MSDDDHERLAREQEREVADLEHESAKLGDEIDGAKDDLAGLESTQSIATPAPEIEGDATPDPEANEPPPETRVTGRDSNDDERVDQGV